MRIALIAAAVLACCLTANAQTYPLGMAQTNGPADERQGAKAILHARLYITPDQVIQDGMLVVAKGRVVYAGAIRPLQAGEQGYDAKGKTIYPAFVEMASDYGMPQGQGPDGTPWYLKPPQYERANTAARYWNEHCRPELRAAALFKADEGQAAPLRKIGFAYALTQPKEGVARGTAALVALRPDVATQPGPIIKADAAAGFGFSRVKSSAQQYPGSLMGAIALLRQLYLDGAAYTGTPANQSLDALRQTASLPQLFDAGNKDNLLRAIRLGNEAGKTYILKSNGQEYQRLEELKAAKAQLIVPLAFPKAPDVKDALEADQLELADLMHYERAPYNAAQLRAAGLRIALTSDMLKDKADFWPALRKAVKAGLPEAEALRALTETPAGMLKSGDLVGSLKVGSQASFIIADKSLFTKEGIVLETWVAGERYVQQDAFGPSLAGTWKLTLGADTGYRFIVSPKGDYTIKGRGKDTSGRKMEGSFVAPMLTLSGKTALDTTGPLRLTGWLGSASPQETTLEGTAVRPNGQTLTWTATRKGEPTQEPDTAKFKPTVLAGGPLPYPVSPFGRAALPKAETVLFKNATLWTNETGGKQEQTDLLVQNGRIAAIGKSLAAPAGAKTIDATGRHITPGIIDEHSHIAIAGGVNECTHAVTAEARVGDVIDPDDVNIYRHLAGGVVAVQQLHGSCNVIGGQSSLIKLRWGQTAEGMKIAGAAGFIKCALGENVKQSNSSDLYTVRYPQTRMGVEQTFKDAFMRARAYQAEQTAYAKLTPAQKKTAVAPRKDLQLEAVLEILEKRRFITCHSYVASEIAMLMRLADSNGFKVNTFTHILEGYKVADLMAKHGVGASTFSDWWYYKAEVQDAIPYNAAILTRAGVVTAINSDDAEMARRLNQEAAKTIRYGGMTEEEAMKMITLNPAKLLHLDAKMGSLKVGKDADIVLWNTHPFAAGAHPLRTVIDGATYFELAEDSLMRLRIATEKNRLIQFVATEKDKPAGGGTQPFAKPKRRGWTCDDAHSRDESWGQ